MNPAKPGNVEDIVLEIVRTCSSKAQKSTQISLKIELDTELLESGALDSIAMVELMIALVDQFGLSGRSLRETFRQKSSAVSTARQIAGLVQRLKAGAK